MASLNFLSTPPSFIQDIESRFHWTSQQLENCQSTLNSKRKDQAVLQAKLSDVENELNLVIKKIELLQKNIAVINTRISYENNSIETNKNFEVFLLSAPKELNVDARIQEINGEKESSLKKISNFQKNKDAYTNNLRRLEENQIITQRKINILRTQILESDFTIKISELEVDFHEKLKNLIGQRRNSVISSSSNANNASSSLERTERIPNPLSSNNISNISSSSPVIPSISSSSFVPQFPKLSVLQTLNNPINSVSSSSSTSSNFSSSSSSSSLNASVLSTSSDLDSERTISDDENDHVPTDLSDAFSSNETSETESEKEDTSNENKVSISRLFPTCSITAISESEEQLTITSKEDTLIVNSPKEAPKDLKLILIFNKCVSLRREQWTQYATWLYPEIKPSSICEILYRIRKKQDEQPYIFNDKVYKVSQSLFKYQNSNNSKTNKAKKSRTDTHPQVEILSDEEGDDRTNTYSKSDLKRQIKRLPSKKTSLSSTSSIPHSSSRTSPRNANISSVTSENNCLDDDSHVSSSSNSISSSSSSSRQISEQSSTETVTRTLKVGDKTIEISYPKDAEEREILIILFNECARQNINAWRGFAEAIFPHLSLSTITRRLCCLRKQQIEGGGKITIRGRTYILNTKFAREN